MSVNKIVSVIIPMYNSKKTIEKTIKSVFYQTYKNIEIIVVDDGSNDNSFEIVKNLITDNQDYNIKLIKQSNKGPSAARNRGISESQGDYIAFLDSDDYWRRNKLEVMVNILENNKEIYLLGSLSGSQHKLEDKKIRYLSFKELLYKNYFPTPTVLIRSEVISDIGYFDVRKSFSEDYDFWLRIAYKHKTARYNECLVDITRGNGGLSSKLMRMEKGELEVYNSLYKTKKISFLLYIRLNIFSIIKFLRRIFISKLKELKER